MAKIFCFGKKIIFFDFFFHTKFQDKEPTGIIPLENLQVRENNDIKRKVSVFNLCGQMLDQVDFHKFYVNYNFQLILFSIFSFKF